jgi:hypothetical protein
MRPPKEVSSTMYRFIPTAAAVAAVAAVGAAPAYADHRPGHAGGGGGGGNTSLAVSLSADRTFVRFNPFFTPPGGIAGLSGRITGQGAGGQVVVLEQNPAPLEDGRFDRANREVTSDAQGNFRFTNVVTPVNTQYRVRVAPNTLSAIAPVGVRLRVTVGVSDRTPSRGERVRFRGRVYPEHDNKVVAIQRRGSDGRFRTVKRTLTRDVVGQTYSSYRTRVRIRRTGVYRVIVKPADTDHARGYSRKRTLRVGS